MILINDSIMNDNQILFGNQKFVVGYTVVKDFVYEKLHSKNTAALFLYHAFFGPYLLLSEYFSFMLMESYKSFIRLTHSDKFP